MKLKLFEDQTNHENGTYVEAYLDEESKEALSAFCEDKQIPSPTPKDKFHITIIYSEGEGQGDPTVGDKRFEEPMVAKFEKYNLFGPEKNCLVMELECEALNQLHRQILQDHPTLKHSYDEYAAHVTLSYTIPEGFDLDELEKPDFEILICGYTSSELNPNWKEDNDLD